MQIVEHDAVANAVVAEFLGQLLEQHLIGDSSFFFDVVTHAFRVFHMADLAFGVQLVNIKLHRSREGDNAILCCGMDVLELGLRLQRLFDFFLDLLVVTARRSCLRKRGQH